MEVTRASRADLFDPSALAAMGRLEIVARWIVDGFLSGLHRSPRKGFSVEFADYRPICLATICATSTGRLRHDQTAGW